MTSTKKDLAWFKEHPDAKCRVRKLTNKERQSYARQDRAAWADLWETIHQVTAENELALGAIVPAVLIIKPPGERMIHIPLPALIEGDDADVITRDGEMMSPEAAMEEFLGMSEAPEDD